MKRILLVVTVLLITLATSWAVTPRQLNKMMAQGDKVTIIDVRSTGMYRQGHIQGAINIPASVIAKKRLPPIGKVVVCGDGVREDLSRQAVEALNRKRGIEAEMLQGGFAAWEALNHPIKAVLAASEHATSRTRILRRLRRATPTSFWSICEAVNRPPDHRKAPKCSPCRRPTRA
jgi:rhodanese-related sulfurtransferase